MKKLTFEYTQRDGPLRVFILNEQRWFSPSALAKILWIDQELGRSLTLFPAYSPKVSDLPDSSDNDWLREAIALMDRSNGNANGLGSVNGELL